MQESIAKLPDVEYHKAVEGVSKTTKEAADRWTDNIWTLYDYVSDKYNVEKSEVRDVVDLPRFFRLTWKASRRLQYSAHFAQHGINYDDLDYPS